MDSKALLDNLDVGVAVIAPDWTVGYWSPAAARLTDPHGVRGGAAAVCTVVQPAPDPRPGAQRGRPDPRRQPRGGRAARGPGYPRAARATARRLGAGGAAPGAGRGAA